MLTIRKNVAQRPLALLLLQMLMLLQVGMSSNVNIKNTENSIYCLARMQYIKFSLPPHTFFFWSACLSTICLFKFLLNKMGISLCLFVRIFYIHLLFTSFVFLRCLQQILAGCSVCVINKTAVKILTVRPNCQPWLRARFIPERMLRHRMWALIQIWPLQLTLHFTLWTLILPSRKKEFSLPEPCFLFSWVSVHSTGSVANINFILLILQVYTVVIKYYQTLLTFTPFHWE